MVIEITHARPALRAPRVVTGQATRGAGGRSATLGGDLRDLGEAAEVQVGFQYRRKKGVEELYTKDDTWTETPLRPLTAPGPFTAEVAGLEAGVDYEFRATVRHPLLTLFGEDAVVPAGR